MQPCSTSCAPTEGAAKTAGERLSALEEAHRQLGDKYGKALGQVKLLQGEARQWEARVQVLRRDDYASSPNAAAA